MPRHCRRDYTYLPLLLLTLPIIQLRINISSKTDDIDAQLSEMAADPAIQKELQEGAS